MLNFLGYGSAFNLKCGNTAAYMNYGDDRILIDCGETVFSRLKDSDFWGGHVHVFVTHNHPDHIGSLGSLIFFNYFVKKRETAVYGNKETREILTMQGCYPDLYNFVEIVPKKTYSFPINNIMLEGCKIAAVETHHANGMTCYGFLIKSLQTNTVTYYSGDADEIPEIILDNFKKGKIDVMYIDTCWIESKGRSHHLHYKKLRKLIPDDRHKVYIMHTDEGFNKTQAHQDGFFVVGGWKE